MFFSAKTVTKREAQRWDKEGGERGKTEWQRERKLKIEKNNKESRISRKKKKHKKARKRNQKSVFGTKENREEKEKEGEGEREKIN